MSKTALITGSTDGIGRAVALQLAHAGYAIHVLGRSAQRGASLVGELQAIGPEREHKLYIVDLGTIASNKKFLAQYTAEHRKLDLLVLNANMARRRPVTGPDGLDTVFVIGFLSRYLFTLQLEGLLKRAESPRVLQIGGATMTARIDYKKLSNPTYGGLRSTAMSFRAANYLARFVNQTGMSEVPHEFMEPGVVDTATTRETGAIMRFIIYNFMKPMRPEASAAAIKEHLTRTKPADWAGKFSLLGRAKEPRKSVANGLDEFDKLLEFSARFAKG